MDPATQTVISLLSGPIGQLTGFVTAIIGVYLSIMVVTALAQAHLGAVAGRPQPMAEALEQIIMAVICFAIAINAMALRNYVIGQLGPMSDPAKAGVMDEAVKVWFVLGAWLVRTVISAVGASLAVGVALGAFEAQLGALTGSPDAVAKFVTRLVAVVLTALATGFGMQLVNLIVHAAL
jgi:hypothetical protein